MRIPPEKAEARAGHRPAENRQLRRARIARQLQIIGELAIAAVYASTVNAPAGDHHQTDRQAVQAVRDIHRVARSHHYQHEEQIERQKRQRISKRIPHQRVNQQVRLELFEKRHVQRRRISAVILHDRQHAGDHGRHQHLQPEFLLRVSPRLRLFITFA